MANGKMIEFHAVMEDETGCEFGVTVEAESRAAARDQVEEDYPESRLVQLESPEDAAERERRVWARAEAEADGDYGQWEYEQEWG